MAKGVGQKGVEPKIGFEPGYMLLTFFQIFYGLLSRTKGSEATSRGLEPQYRLYILHFIPETIPKFYLFLKKNYDNPHIKSNVSTARGFESQHTLCFLTLYTKNYTKIQFLKHKNQFRPLIILSHTGDADSGYSWLVCASSSNQDFLSNRKWLGIKL